MLLWSISPLLRHSVTIVYCRIDIRAKNLLLRTWLLGGGPKDRDQSHERCLLLDKHFLCVDCLESHNLNVDMLWPNLHSPTAWGCEVVTHVYVFFRLSSRCESWPQDNWAMPLTVRLHFINSQLFSSVVIIMTTFGWCTDGGKCERHAAWSRSIKMPEDDDDEAVIVDCFRALVASEKFTIQIALQSPC